MTKPLGFSGPASGVGIDLGRHMLVYLRANVTIPIFFCFHYYLSTDAHSAGSADTVYSLSSTFTLRHFDFGSAS